MNISGYLPAAENFYQIVNSFSLETHLNPLKWVPSTVPSSEVMMRVVEELPWKQALLFGAATYITYQVVKKYFTHATPPQIEQVEPINLDFNQSSEILQTKSDLWQPLQVLKETCNQNPEIKRQHILLQRQLLYSLFLELDPDNASIAQENIERLEKANALPGTKEEAQARIDDVDEYMNDYGDQKTEHEDSVSTFFQGQSLRDHLQKLAQENPVKFDSLMQRYLGELQEKYRQFVDLQNEIDAIASANPSSEELAYIWHFLFFLTNE